ncbi:hypothetical protein ABZS68_39675 [Streptomyces sp. NPDC005571]
MPVEDRVASTWEPLITTADSFPLWPHRFPVGPAALHDPSFSNSPPKNWH